MIGKCELAGWLACLVLQGVEILALDFGFREAEMGGEVEVEMRDLL